MRTLVLVRHGESEWNAEGRFTGWTDIGLSSRGREEARHAGGLLRASGVEFRFAYTSVLTRAIETLHIIQSEMGLAWIPEFKDWRLNEKHYGFLQGRSKEEAVREFGAEQVHLWRRAYNCPPLPADDEAARQLEADPRYGQVEKSLIPRTESLKDTRERVEACWRQQLAPVLLHRRNLLVVAHGNSLRALMMLLQDLTPEQVERLEIPTGLPLVVDMDETLQLQSVHYLGMSAEESGFNPY